MYYTVIVDNSTSKALKEKLILTKSLLRRAENLLEYNFVVVYRSGKENVVLYFLSRIHQVELSSQDESG